MTCLVCGDPLEDLKVRYCNRDCQARAKYLRARERVAQTEERKVAA